MIVPINSVPINSVPINVEIASMLRFPIFQSLFFILGRFPLLYRS